MYRQNYWLRINQIQRQQTLDVKRVFDLYDQHSMAPEDLRSQDPSQTSLFQLPHQPECGFFPQGFLKNYSSKMI